MILKSTSDQSSLSTLCSYTIFNGPSISASFYVKFECARGSEKSSTHISSSTKTDWSTVRKSVFTFEAHFEGWFKFASLKSSSNTVNITEQIVGNVVKQLLKWLTFNPISKADQTIVFENMWDPKNIIWSKKQRFELASPIKQPLAYIVKKKLSKRGRYRWMLANYANYTNLEVITKDIDWQWFHHDEHHATLGIKLLNFYNKSCRNVWCQKIVGVTCQLWSPDFTSDIFLQG